MSCIDKLERGSIAGELRAWAKDIKPVRPILSADMFFAARLIEAQRHALRTAHDRLIEPAESGGGALDALTILADALADGAHSQPLEV